MTAWLLGFLLHSTLWCGLAWLWTRQRPGMHARWRETIWLTAIAASLITPTAQTFGAHSAASWRLPLPASWAATADPTLGPPPGSGAEHFEVRAPQATAAHELGESWRRVAPWVWLAVAGGLLLCYGGRLGALRRRLGPREIVTDGRARRALAELGHHAGLRRVPKLTESENLGSPIALGTGRRAEICVPTRALHELEDDQFRAMLGHEVAHHLRRDPLRLGVLNTLQAVFFFQPLFGVAVRAVHFAAEEQCDDWAAHHAEDRFAMASCLTEVAAWLLPRDRRLPVPCMARRRSQLRVRVDRLMDEQAGSKPPRRVWRWLASTGLLALAPWLAPGIAPASAMPPGSSSAAETGSATGLASELAAIDALAAQLDAQLQLLSEELGPLADTPRYRAQLEALQAQATQLRQTRGLLRSTLRALDDVHSSSEDTPNPFPSTDSNHR